jgi:hypothetical protein
LYIFQFIYLRSIYLLDYIKAPPFEPDSLFAGYAWARYKYVTRNETLVMNAPRLEWTDNYAMSVVSNNAVNLNLGINDINKETNSNTT